MKYLLYYNMKKSQISLYIYNSIKYFTKPIINLSGFSMLNHCVIKWSDSQRLCRKEPDGYFTSETKIETILTLSKKTNFPELTLVIWEKGSVSGFW